MTITHYREASVRSLRDRIYGRSSDTNWSNCRDHWMTPRSVRWLAEQVRREMKDQDQTVEQLVDACVLRHEMICP